MNKRWLWVGLGIVFILLTIWLPQLDRVDPTATAISMITQTVDDGDGVLFTATSTLPITETLVPPPVETATEEFAPPNLPPGIVLTDTPEGFDPTLEPTSTAFGRRAGISSIQAIAQPLRVQGLSFVKGDGSRFIAAGINLEMYRDYANGCGWVSDGQYTARLAMRDKLVALGVNAVRLNYAYRFLQTAANFQRYMEMAQLLAEAGIYVMPSDHSYTGGTPPSYVAANPAPTYTMMKQIVDNANSRGIGAMLIMNPWNELSPDISIASWKTLQNGVLTYLRSNVLFTGIVVLDGTGWATLLDVNAFKAVMAFDASLLGGVPNVAFSNHLYPNIQDLPAKIWTASNQVPLVVGELGQENPGASPLDPQYVKTTIAGALNTGIPNGHNGLFAWIFAWCDTNKMIEDWTDPAVAYSASSPLTSHGVLWQDNYYKKLPSGQLTPIPPPAPTGTKTATPSGTPTRTVLPTNSPQPSTSATPSRTTAPTSTIAPSATISPTPTRTPSGGERWSIWGTFGGMEVNITIERQQ